MPPLCEQDSLTVKIFVLYRIDNAWSRLPWRIRAHRRDPSMTVEAYRRPITNPRASIPVATRKKPPFASSPSSQSGTAAPFLVVEGNHVGKYGCGRVRGHDGEPGYKLLISRQAHRRAAARRRQGNGVRVLENPMGQVALHDQHGCLSTSRHPKFQYRLLQAAVNRSENTRPGAGEIMMSTRQ
jgi:hypothetical protein